MLLLNLLYWYFLAVTPPRIQGCISPRNGTCNRVFIYGDNLTIVAVCCIMCRLRFLSKPRRRLMLTRLLLLLLLCLAVSRCRMLNRRSRCGRWRLIWAIRVP